MEKFQKKVKENGGDFPDLFTANLLRIVYKMKPLISTGNKAGYGHRCKGGNLKVRRVKKKLANEKAKLCKRGEHSRSRDRPQRQSQKSCNRSAPHDNHHRINPPAGKWESKQLIAAGVLPAFLQGQAKPSMCHDPVRIVNNPDGSLQRVAMIQNALAKERSDKRKTQREIEMNSIPKDVNKIWIDQIAMA